jgi:hypothetical protein
MEKQIITKFLAEYEITNDKDDYVTQLELSNWSDKNGYRVSKFLKYLQEHCVERDLLNVKNKSYKYEKICTGIKNKTPPAFPAEPLTKAEIAEEPEVIAPGKPFEEEEDAMPLSDLDDASLKAFDEWFISVKTHRMHHIDDYVPWTQSSHGDEYLIIEQDGHKELVLKSVIKDLLSN